VLRIQHAMQEALCGMLVASTLNQDVKHGPILVDGAPQPVPTFVHRERHLVQKPLVATSWVAPTKLTWQQRAELAALQTDGFVADLDRHAPASSSSTSRWLSEKR